jgi:hypothetical protein
MTYIVTVIGYESGKKVERQENVEADFYVKDEHNNAIFYQKPIDSFMPDLFVVEYHAFNHMKIEILPDTVAV